MKWYDLPEERRRLILDEAAARAGVSRHAIEKDWWVTIVLKAIFNTPYAKDIIFKGGTSLSKSWQLIERFSEDIDLAINREALGFGDELSISEIKRLKRRGAEFTIGEFKEALDKAMKDLGILFFQYNIRATPIRPDMPDADPQELFIEYISMLDPNPYVLPQVKIEMSVRSLMDPVFERTITSLMDEVIPGQQYAGEPFTVTAIDPKITILEKIFLLHEEFTKPEARIKSYRMSRHLHDLERTMDTVFGQAAINDPALYTRIYEHRKHMIRHRHVSYDNHGQGSIRFVPPAAWLPAFRQDYEQMKLEMFRGDVMAFEALVERLTEFQQRIRNSLPAA